MDQKQLKRINAFEALHMLSIKMGNIAEFDSAHSKFASKQEKRAFLNKMLPVLEVNYDVIKCPPPCTCRRLWPAHIEGSEPLLSQVRPEPASWNRNDVEPF